MAELSPQEKFSVLYHNIFDYPLTFGDLVKWKAAKEKIKRISNVEVSQKDKFFFIKGREGLNFKRIKNERSSKEKLKIASKASKYISLIPTVKFVGITGALAMNNANEESDIDLMIITKKNYLWTTRPLVYLILIFSGLKIREPNNKNEKNKLCLNMWLDESYLSWPKKDQNFYTAHEIGQILPIFNKNNTYEIFLWKNKWILDYWPNALRIKKIEREKWRKSKDNLIEKFFFNLQISYMKNKITREIVKKHRAIFHPNDWAKMVLTRLGSFD